MSAATDPVDRVAVSIDIGTYSCGKIPPFSGGSYIFFELLRDLALLQC